MSQLLVACALITAMLACLAGIGGALRWLWQVLRALSRLADDLTGEPARNGQEARPGLLDRLKAIEDKLQRLDDFERRLAALEAQLRPNGGSSLRDAVDRIEQTAAA